MTSSDPRAGQEAARLLAAAQEWLRTSAPHLAPLAPDGEPCSCPLCRAVSGVREADPDSVGRWIDSAVAAFGSLVAQAGDLAASRSPEEYAGPAGGDASGAPGTDEAPAGGDAADGYLVKDDSHAEGATDDESPGQDGPRARRVRRVPITREGGTPTS